MEFTLEPKHQFFEANGIRLHCAIQGSGPPMILLHGFPEFWYCWRHQITEFSHDFRVVAPDMRGYNTSDKPLQVSEYEIGTLVSDIRALMEALGDEKAILAAHDWGGVVAWVFAMRHPEYLHRLVILNAPHPVLYARSLLSDPEQRSASEYILLLRSSRAEEVLSRNRFEWLQAAVFQGCRDPSTFTEKDRAAYIEAWSQPGALTGGLNYYRASSMLEVLEQEEPDKPGKIIDVPSITVPTLVIWGEKDQALLTHLLDGLETYVDNLTIQRIPDATHWVQQDAPELVNRYIRDFVS